MLENMLEKACLPLTDIPYILAYFSRRLTVPHDLSKVQQHVPLKREARGGSTFSKARFQSFLTQFPIRFRGSFAMFFASTSA